jgi:hypothetical protein
MTLNTILNLLRRDGLRQIDDKPLQFWSVIPFWRTTSHGDMKFKEFASGNLIED